MCVETVDNACAIADTLLNGVRARLCGHSIAVSVRFDKPIVDMMRVPVMTRCVHTECKSKYYTRFVTRQRRASVTTELCVCGV